MAMAWVNRPKVREILSQLGGDSRPVTHQILDDLPPGNTLDHLRSVLVAAGALPERDERLVKLGPPQPSPGHTRASGECCTGTRPGITCGGSGSAWAQVAPLTCNA